MVTFADNQHAKFEGARASGRARDIESRAGPRTALLGTLLTCSVFAAAPAQAQFGSCERADLQKLADDYIQAQSTGDLTKIPFTLWMNYNEQMDLGTMSTGVISKPLKIDFHRSLIDPEDCQVYTEVIVTDPAHPYVLGVTLDARGDKVNAIDMVATDAGDWLFNAKRTLAYSKAENWGVIPEDQRDSRKTIIAAANAYLDKFDDKSVVVPWGTPCARLEGGLYTGKGEPGEATAEDTCDVGVPSGVKLTERRYIVDPTIGAVAVMLRFGDKKRPDVHTFRIEHGKIRYVHTITVCDEDNCGLPMSPEVRKMLQDK